jgi:hypothetical protein
MKINQTTFTDKAFTMIEIAIAVGVIGLALVAIIGILPQGMNVQKDNREDTIISQDAPYLMDAIRNGEMRNNSGILTNYVDSVIISNLTDGMFTNYHIAGIIGDAGSPNSFGDSNIVGLLSTPEYDPRIPLIGNLVVTNTVTAIIRAMSGSAIEQTGAYTNMAFRYQLTVENVPWNSIASDSINFSNVNYVANTPDWIIRSNRWREAPFLTNSLHELRLKFAWPVILNPDGTVAYVGPNRQTYRSLVSSHLAMSNFVSGPFIGSLWFFQPQYYTNNF